jgi:hypothetical protein
MITHINNHCNEGFMHIKRKNQDKNKNEKNEEISN